MRSAIIRVVAGSLWPYIQTLLRIYLTRWGRNLLSSALEAVQEAERQSTTGDRKWTSEEKRLWAIEQLRKRDWGGGNAIADRWINLAIELAVAKLQPREK